MGLPYIEFQSISKTEVLNKNEKSNKNQSQNDDSGSIVNRIVLFDIYGYGNDKSCGGALLLRLRSSGTGMLRPAARTGTRCVSAKRL